MGALGIQRAILVRMGELTLKGRNREGFVSRLLADIQTRLAGHDCSVRLEYDRIFVEDYKEGSEQGLLDVLALVQGIHSLSSCLVTDSDFSEFLEPAVRLMEPNRERSFKIEARRADKRFPINSQEIARSLAPLILARVPMSVDVNNPDTVLYIEVRRKRTYFFTRIINASGGLPNRSGGRVLVLLSGGIDSPVAGYLLARRGQSVDYLTFVTPPHTTDQSLHKTAALVRILRTATGQRSRLFVCNFTPLLHELGHVRYENYRIVAMRRYFMRIAALLADRVDAQALATGEALSQVASQTLESLVVIQQATDKLVLRPLVVMDKAEIIAVAKRIGTYPVSVLPFPDACALFAPAMPVTKPTSEKMALVEGDLQLADDIAAMVEGQIKEMDVDQAPPLTYN